MTEPNTKKFPKVAYWGVFLVSTAICFGFLFLKPAWFWIMLPFMLTSLVYALDVL